MKNNSILVFLILLGCNLHSQTDLINKKYVAWISPSNATHVYGLMFNYWPRNQGSKFPDNYPQINGIELNINPLGAFMPFLLTINSLDPETHQPLSSENIEAINFKEYKHINGLQIGLINMEKSVINGLDINASGSFESKTNGITLSLVMNKHYVVNGVTFATIGNHDIKCNGAQIGLFNSCKDLKGIQIGLWNKNQKRSLPFINWNFKN